MQFFTGISRHTQPKSYMLSWTEFVRYSKIMHCWILINIIILTQQIICSGLLLYDLKCTLVVNILRINFLSRFRTAGSLLPRSASTNDRLLVQTSSQLTRNNNNGLNTIATTTGSHSYETPWDLPDRYVTEILLIVHAIVEASSSTCVRMVIGVLRRFPQFVDWTSQTHSVKIFLR